MAGLKATATLCYDGHNPDTRVRHRRVRGRVNSRAHKTPLMPSRRSQQHDHNAKNINILYHYIYIITYIRKRSLLIYKSSKRLVFEMSSRPKTGMTIHYVMQATNCAAAHNA